MVPPAALRLPVVTVLASASSRMVRPASTVTAPAMLSVLPVWLPRMMSPPVAVMAPTWAMALLPVALSVPVMPRLLRSMPAVMMALLVTPLPALVEISNMPAPTLIGPLIASPPAFTRMRLPAETLMPPSVEIRLVAEDSFTVPAAPKPLRSVPVVRPPAVCVTPPVPADKSIVPVAPVSTFAPSTTAPAGSLARSVMVRPAPVVNGAATSSVPAAVETRVMPPLVVVTAPPTTSARLLATVMSLLAFTALSTSAPPN